jgi:hypothetical protein
MAIAQAKLRSDATKAGNDFEAASLSSPPDVVGDWLLSLAERPNDTRSQADTKPSSPSVSGARRATEKSSWPSGRQPIPSYDRSIPTARPASVDRPPALHSDR